MKSSSLIIKLIITAILGTMGIAYILHKPPTAEINSYQKQSMPKPYRYKKENNNGYMSSEQSGDSDDISLMGKKGSYDEHTIGKNK